ncbi:hypothetical protein [Azospirillum sp. B4]|uniref:hypothetical protein n=1 Tax=Azospirillum sp. B4 TaxID=95605 RepID=UPI0011DD071A|nr:hypothetical protein [Azospirillum sp. B4]
MLYYAIIDYDVLDDQITSDAPHYHSLMYIIKAINQNMRIILDKNGKIKDHYKDSLMKMANGKGNAPYISALMTDILKAGSKSIVNISLSRGTIPETLSSLADTWPADWAIVEKPSSRFTCTQIEASTFMTSPIDKCREEIAFNGLDVQACDEKVVKEHIRRLVHKSENVTIIDKFFGSASENTPFKKGIELIIDCWIESGALQNPNPTIHIITSMGKDTGTPTSKPELDRVSEYRRAFIDKFQRSVISDLRNKYDNRNITLKIHFKLDDSKEKILHDRFIISQNGAARLTRGIDFACRSGEFSFQSIKNEPCRMNHAQNCLALPDALEPIELKFRQPLTKTKASGHRRFR